MTNLEHYRIFYTTAKEQNFSKAASSLFITQPSVSHAIKQLETQLGVSLFVRHSKGVFLTTEGNVLYSYIKQAFAHIETGERHLQSLKALESGSITIASSDSICKHYLLPRVPSFLKRWPKLDIKFQHGSTPDIMKKLEQGRIDIGIVHLPINEKDVEITPFTSTTCLFCASPTYKTLHNGTHSLTELTRYPLVSFSAGSSTRSFLEHLFQQQGQTFSPELEVGSIELLIECDKLGMGIGFVAKELIKKELEQGELVEIPVDIAIPTREIALITKKAAPLSIAARRFYSHLLAN